MIIIKENKSYYANYKAFIDDYRNPKDAVLYDENCKMLRASSTKASDWDVYRSYKAFCTAIDNRGIPEMVSFDNDLVEGHYGAYVKANQCGYYEWQNLTDTGIHCAVYLIEKCKERNVPFPKYWVHSANQFSRPIIKKLVEDYNQSLKTRS